MRLQRQQGLTLFELLFVLAILGILLAITAPALQTDRIAVSQAARGMAAQIVRTRMEALRLNTPVGFHADQAAQHYFLFIDKDASYSYTSGDELLSATASQFGRGEYAAVRLNSTATLVFDPRGMLRNASADTIIDLNNRTNSYLKQVRVSLQGKSTVL